MGIRDEINAQRAQFEIVKAEIKRLQATIAAETDGTATPEQVTQMEALTASLEEYTEQMGILIEKLGAATNAGDNFAIKMGGMLGLQEDYNQSLLGTIDLALSTSEGFEGMTKRMKKMFKPANMLASAFDKVLESTKKLVMEQDAALVEFNKATGATRLHGEELLKLEDKMYHHGIMMAEATAAYISLKKSVYNYSSMSKSTRSAMAETTALLEKMGVSSEVTANNMQYSIAVLGQAGEAAEKTQRELFGLAAAIAMPQAEMADAFKDAMPKLAWFGNKSTEVFRKLVVNARKANMEVGEVLGIVEQFDTFEGAATSVGKLNAMLGGPFLNSMEMVTTTDPTERMKLLSEALRNAGKSWDDMGEFERKAIANAAGLEDVASLAKVMRGEFDESATGMGKSAAEMKMLAEQAKEFNTFQDELNQTMRSFAVAVKPLLDFLKSLLDGYQQLVKAHPGLDRAIGKTILAVGGLKIAMNLLGKSMWKPPLGLIVLLGSLIYLIASMEGPASAATYAAIALAAGIAAIAYAYLSLDVASGGLLFVIGLVVSAIALLVLAFFDLGEVMWHESASDGIIPTMATATSGFEMFGKMIAWVGSKIAEMVSWLIEAASAVHGVENAFSNAGTWAQSWNPWGEETTPVSPNVPAISAAGANIRNATAQRSSAQASKAAEAHVTITMDGEHAKKFVAEVSTPIAGKVAANTAPAAVAGNPNAARRGAKSVRYG